LAGLLSGGLNTSEGALAAIAVNGLDGLLIQLTAHHARPGRGLLTARAGGIAIAAAAFFGVGGSAAADNCRIRPGTDLPRREDVVVGDELVDRPIVVADDAGVRAGKTGKAWEDESGAGGWAALVRG
jgi:hypothetical protein